VLEQKVLEYNQEAAKKTFEAASYETKNIRLKADMEEASKIYQEL